MKDLNMSCTKTCTKTQHWSGSNFQTGLSLLSDFVLNNEHSEGTFLHLS